jgi:putative methyltransferase (TIGR04325 family)
MLGNAARVLLSRTSIGATLRRLPGVEALYREHFWSGPKYVNQFCGYYSSYEEALAAIPKSLSEGWEHQTVVAADHFQPTIFSTMFWLSRILEEGFRVTDFGGAVGQTHTALAQRMSIPNGVRWTVVDLPPAVQRGAKLASERGTEGLYFSENLEDVDGCDVFLSRGCIQYVETPLTALLKSLHALPRYILLDKVPMTDGREFVTHQNLMSSAVPYQVFNRTKFLSSLGDLGFKIRDEWPVQELSCSIPFHPELFLECHSGMLLQLSAP